MPTEETHQGPIDVLHLRACNFVGGPERQILRYVRHGAAYDGNGGVRTALATFVDRTEGEGRDLLAAAAAADIEAVGLDGGGWHDLVGLRQLISLLRRRKVRLLCAHGYRPDLLGLWAARRCRLPMVSFLRGWTGEDWKVRALDHLDRRYFLPRADRIVCLSELQAGRVAAMGIPRDCIRVVPNAVEPPASTREPARRELRARFGVSDDALLVGAAGRLSPEKGAADLLQAIASMPSSPGTEFLIFGDGPMRTTLESQRQSLGLTQVRFTGFQPDFPSLVPGLDLLVNPSHTEEMPNVVMEAMAAEVAVVATAVGGVPEIAGDHLALTLVPARDPAAMAAAMAPLLADTEARRSLAAAGRQRIDAAFSPARQRQKLLALYAEFLA